MTACILVIPGNDPLVLPAPSRSALEGAGFVITEERRPSYLFDSSVLVTVEYERIRHPLAIL